MSIDGRILKLSIKLNDPALAMKLVKAGYDTPTKIRKATNAELEAINGIGKTTVTSLRKVCPRR